MTSTIAQEPDDILNHLAGIGMLSPGSATRPLGDGSVNSVFRVRLATGEEGVLRIGPSRGDVASGPSWMRFDALACEAVVLDRVRAAVRCVPAPLAAGFRGRPWVVLPIVPGRPLAEVLPEMGASELARMWREIGALTRRLHGEPAPWFGTPDGRHRFPDWTAMVCADAEGLLADARRFGLDPLPFEEVLEEVRASDDALREVATPAVVHSDLDPRHVFVQKGPTGWEITGVIDWEYARYVDPLSESLLVEMVARPEGDADREAFLAGYGLDAIALSGSALLARQRIYRGITRGWAVTDAARLSVVGDS